jgi:hypothetical protein
VLNLKELSDFSMLFLGLFFTAFLIILSAGFSFAVIKTSFKLSTEADNFTFINRSLISLGT